MEGRCKVYVGQQSKNVGGQEEGGSQSIAETDKWIDP